MAGAAVVIFSAFRLVELHRPGQCLVSSGGLAELSAFSGAGPAALQIWPAWVACLAALGCAAAFVRGRRISASHGALLIAGLVGGLGWLLAGGALVGPGIRLVPAYSMAFGLGLFALATALATRTYLGIRGRASA